MKPLTLTVALLALAAAPAQATPLTPSFTFSFTDGISTIAGDIYGQARDGTDGQGNWEATRVVVTSAPDALRLLARRVCCVLDFGDTIGGLHTQRWDLLDGEALQAIYFRQILCSGDCFTFFLQFHDRDQVVGHISAALGNGHGGILEQQEVHGPLTLQAVPEPASLILVGTGVVGLLARRRRSRDR